MPRLRDALAQRLASGALQLDGGERGLQRTALGLEPHGADRRVDPVAVGGLQDGLGRVFALVEVGRDDALGRCA